MLSDFNYQGFKREVKTSEQLRLAIEKIAQAIE